MDGSKAPVTVTTSTITEHILDKTTKRWLGLGPLDHIPGPQPVIRAMVFVNKRPVIYDQQLTTGHCLVTTKGHSYILFTYNLCFNQRPYWKQRLEQLRRQASLIE